MRGRDRLGWGLMWLVVTALVSCSGGGAKGVATDFVHKYYQEIDQQGALKLSEGLARAKLVGELELVKGIRASGVKVEDAKPRISSRLVQRRTPEAEKEFFVFQLTIKGRDSRPVQKVVYVTTSFGGSNWKVTNFGEMPASG